MFSAPALAAALSITPDLPFNSMAIFYSAVIAMGILVLITIPLAIGYIGTLIHQSQRNAKHLKEALDGYKLVIIQGGG